MANEDITYCGNTDCKVVICRRNQKNIKRHDILHSFAMFEGSEVCPDIPESEVNDGQYKREIKEDMKL